MPTWTEGTEGVVTLPDGTRFRGRALRGEPDSADLRIRLTGWPYPAEATGSLRLCWPDFGVPASGRHTVGVLRGALGRAGQERVEIVCRGGAGRTGAAIAILARMAGVPAAEAVGWTREHYRADAVETPWQRWFVERVDVSG